jgi:hypothetical protein
MPHEVNPAWVEHQHLDHQLEALPVAALQGHAQSTFPLYALRQCERDQRVVEVGADLFRMRVLRVALDVLHLICQLPEEDAQEIGRSVVQVQDVRVIREKHI